MLPDYHNSSDLLIDISKNLLYSKLIIQLNKDFSLANFDFNLRVKISPLILKMELQKAVKNLIVNDFNTYKNILYIVDVPEGLLKKIESSNIDNYTERVAFIILKRVWKKVWFKNKYSNNF